MSLTGALALVAIVATISITLLNIIKAIVNRAPQWGKNGNLAVPPLFEKMFEKAASERDAKIRRLEDRIAVLEKIVIDSYQPRKLADEIERLKS